MNDHEKEAAVAREIEIFSKVLKEGGVESSIPSMFTYWASKYLSPRLKDVFSEVDVSRLFAREIYNTYTESLELGASPGKVFKILSLGSGDCSNEILVSKHLKEFGLRFDLVCTDLNPEVLEFASRRANKEGVGSGMSYKAVNLNDDFPSGKYDCVIVNHSLHHFIELEKIFDNVKNCLYEHGTFIISDMIGRNGHMRWPEALVFVEQLWELLPLKKRKHVQSGYIQEKYVNYDCTISDPFEGIRSQDILPLLIERFNFQKFVGHGNVIDIFIDRIYGGNFSPASEEDRLFIDYVEKLNTSLIDFGIVKPTAMFARIGKQKVDCKFSRWDPHFSVRRVGDE